LPVLPALRPCRQSGRSNRAQVPCTDGSLSVTKADLTLLTEINDNATDGVAVTAVPLGHTVHDHASFSGAVTGFVPTLANVSYTFNGGAAGTGGTSSNEGPLGAGSDLFKASFSGDANYNQATSADEPLTVNKAQLAIATAVHDSTHSDKTNQSVPLGSVMHDQATVS